MARLIASSTALFVCDMQTAFRRSIQYYPEIIANTSRLVKAAKVLNMPIIVTEQYPTGLGETVEEISGLLPESVTRHPKTKFSMCIPDVLQCHSDNKDKFKSVLLTGIESHVCVLQTALDLLDADYIVHIAADCVSSRSLVDRKFAFKRLEQAGALFTTSESAILQLCQDASDPKFKDLRKIIMKPTQDPGLINEVPDERLKSD